jgi:hypothetical protein
MEKELILCGTDNNFSLIGKKFRTRDGYRGHIVNVFTDEGEEIVTYKRWSKRKQGWYYFSDYLELFMIQFDYGAKWL